MVCCTTNCRPYILTWPNLNSDGVKDTAVKVKAKDLFIKNKAKVEDIQGKNMKACAAVVQTYVVMYTLLKNMTNWHNNF